MTQDAFLKESTDQAAIDGRIVPTSLTYRAPGKPPE